MTIDGGSENAPIPGFVYLIGPLDDCHKIGFSVDPELRAKALSRPGKPLSVVHRIATADMRWLESVLHAGYDSVRVGGEWFRLAADDVATLSCLAEVHGDDDLPEIFRQFGDATHSRRRVPDFAPRQPGFLVRLPIAYRAAITALATQTRRTISGEVQVALDTHLKANPLTAA